MKKLSKAAHNIEGQPMFKLLAHVLDLERQGKTMTDKPNILYVFADQMRASAMGWALAPTPGSMAVTRQTTPTTGGHG